MLCWAEERIQFLLNSIVTFGIETERLATGLVLPDMDDLVFYEVTMNKAEDEVYLITGNLKHYPTQPNIVSPAEMLVILEVES